MRSPNRPGGSRSKSTHSLTQTLALVYQWSKIPDTDSTKNGQSRDEFRFQQSNMFFVLVDNRKHPRRREGVFSLEIDF